MGRIQNTIAIPIYRVLLYPVILTLHNDTVCIHTLIDVYIHRKEGQSTLTLKELETLFN